MNLNSIGFAQTPVNTSVIRGLDYGPFRDGESPDLQTFPSQAELAQDVDILAGITSFVRTYSTCNGFATLIPLGAAAGLQVVPGAFLSAAQPSVTAMETSCLINAINGYAGSYPLCCGRDRGDLAAGIDDRSADL
jgi:exo-beta-1,3-glucanase (GH17 family)